MPVPLPRTHVPVPARLAVAVAVSSAVTALAHRLPAPRAGGWVRTNYRGRPVSLSTGLAAALGATAGSLATTGRVRTAAMIIAPAAALAGAYDDLCAPSAETAADKGLAGHLAAIRSGRVSGGVAKAALIGVASLAAATLTRAGRGPVELALRGGLIAATANLVNLFDLRPGRAGKVTAAVAALSLGGPGGGIAAAVLGATAASLPHDLAERGMLGDLGANTLGALLGLRLAALPPGRRNCAGAVVLALTVASEGVSFSQVIDETPVLRRIDQLGRAES